MQLEYAFGSLEAEYPDEMREDGLPASADERQSDAIHRRRHGKDHWEVAFPHEHEVRRIGFDHPGFYHFT